MARAERPYAVRPERLYTRDDLMQGWHPGADHSATLDGRIYAYVKAHGGRAPDMEEGLAQRIHDHFIDVALAAFLMQAGRPVVGIMGGSSTGAADPNYRRVVKLAASLTERGYLVAVVGVPLNLAVFDIDAAGAVIRAHPEIAHWAVGGHSLGGSMAAQFADSHRGTVVALVLWASYSAADLSDDGLAVLSAYGTLDHGVPSFTSAANTAKLGTNMTFRVVDGGNHE